MRRTILTIAVLALISACDKEPAAEPPTTDDSVAAASEEDVQGYVFSQWGYDIPKEDPGECPDGFNVGDDEFYSKEYAAVKDQVKQLYDAGKREEALKLLPPDACQDPKVIPDPGHVTLNGPASVSGIDLDGVDSKSSSGEQCAHDDFAGGIDNQNWRLMGCVKGYRPDGLFDRQFASRSSVVENGYSTLLEIKVVEGTRENGQVEARLFTGAGPVSTDATGNITRDTSQKVHDDPMYHSDVFKGEIKDGIFTAGPVDAKLRFKVQAIDNHYWFRDLQLRAEMLPDGGMKGVLAGYWDIDNAFNFLTEVHLGKVHLGRAAANNIGYMCAGIYHALPRVADGHPDPKNGKCTSMSTVIDFEAVPAFVIQADTVAQAN